MRTLVLLIAMASVTCGCDQFDETLLLAVLIGISLFMWGAVAAVAQNTDSELGAALAGLVRGGCTLSPDTSLFVVIDRAVTAESSKLPRR